ncbi:hypothetical protein [Lactobacillus amylovorus]|uniref:hypothetical protein n=1 Tax=Lactobacillus amylovorus TaxID=1604 RepID=UPI00232C6765|nr:hypothetical protein [Lactobacillus amylovorus]MDB6263662.1 hypothetical protein [Lactobacillus amylovorus]MDB6265357.1 hypothetical protein [Lactobacillus amylovorus]MDB6269089.1 hypothetical protein [Lactobacillus amylovorus]
MGGRGSRFGKSVKGKKYGSEFSTLLHVGNIKFVRYNGNPSTAPMETQTKNRIYVTVNQENKLKSITFYADGKRYKQIDLDHFHKINGRRVKPHVHLGYFHNENGDDDVNAEESRLVDKVHRIWDNQRRK